MNTNLGIFIARREASWNKLHKNSHLDVLQWAALADELDFIIENLFDVIDPDWQGDHP